MDRRQNEVQVGIVTIASLMVLLIGMMWLKDASVGGGMNRFQVDFPTVEGLQVGDRIQARGIRAGQVEDYEVMDGFVRVSIKLDEEIDLREDAAFTLGTKGIVGEVVIEILPGEGAAVHEGHIFKGRTAATITQMTDVAGNSLEEFRQLTTQLNDLVTEIRGQGKVVETLAQANTTLARLDGSIAENRAAMAATLANLQEASADLRELMASGTVDSAFGSAASAAARADTLLAGLGATARRLDLIVAKLDEGEGSAALLLNDAALYQRADSTMTSLQRLLDEMRRNPKKYFKLNVF
ncbi:MAG: MCE family protein [Krumholzibacteria bacterium]|nr:MCE family protein [Candidatus Krumholzibacteria bacterium]